MAPPTPAAFRAAGGGQRDRLGASLAGLGERARQKGGEKTAKNPTDRGKPGSKRHLISERRGVPLAVVLTGANVHDSNVFEELVEAIEPIKRPGRGRPRKRPEKLHAEKDYEAKKCRQALRNRAYQEPHSQEGQRQQRAAGATSVGGVERTLAWVSR